MIVVASLRFVVRCQNRMVDELEQVGLVGGCYSTQTLPASIKDAHYEVGI